jgi:hypothetical protein
MPTHALHCRQQEVWLLDIPEIDAHSIPLAVIRHMQPQFLQPPPAPQLLPVPQNSCLLSGLVCAQEQALWRTSNHAAQLMRCFSKRVPKRPQSSHGYTYLTKRRNVSTVKDSGVRQASMPKKANNSAHQHIRLTLSMTLSVPTSATISELPLKVPKSHLENSNGMRREYKSSSSDQSSTMGSQVFFEPVSELASPTETPQQPNPRSFHLQISRGS